MSLEIEASDQEFPLPHWLGDEVTKRGRYHNFRLAGTPVNSWPEDLRRGALLGRAASGDRQ